MKSSWNSDLFTFLKLKNPSTGSKVIAHCLWLSLLAIFIPGHFLLMSDCCQVVFASLMFIYFKFSRRFRVLNWVELSWIELSWVELRWIELNWVELNWIRVELSWIELNWVELNCWAELLSWVFELSWIELNWVELSRIDLILMSIW